MNRRGDELKVETSIQRRWLFRFLLAGVSLSFGLVISEVVLRLVGFSYPLRAIYSEHTGYSMTPNANWVHTTEGRGEIRTNRFGFRDVDWTIEKPLGHYRIAAVGDSFVAGQEVAAEDRFTSIMQAQLSPGLVGAQEIEVMNFGQPGHGTAQELITLREKVWQFSPDLVILAFFTANDIQNNLRALEDDSEIPYFELKDGQLVLDASFQDHKPSTAKRSLTAIAPYLRVAQLAFRVKHAQETKTDQRRAKAEGNVPGRPDLSQFWFTSPVNESAIYIAPPDPTWQAAWDITGQIISQIQQETADNHAQFLLVTLSNDIQVHPDRNVRERFLNTIDAEDIFYPERMANAMSAEIGVQILNLAPAMQNHAEQNKLFLHGFKNTRMGTGHWNKDGHRVAGMLIAEWLQANWSKESQKHPNTREATVHGSAPIPIPEHRR